MTINQYIILSAAECCHCANCDVSLSIGDSVSESDGRPFCGQTCVSEHVGRLMARLHGPAAQYDAGIDEDDLDSDMMNKRRD